MPEQKGLLIDTPAYSELIEAIEEIHEKGLTGYVAVWESENHKHDSTKYVVTDFDRQLGEPTLIIRGRGGSGGKYEIVPKPNNPAWIKYHHPDPKNTGWEEELIELAVFSPDFAYAKKEGWEVFLRNPFEVLEKLK